MMVERYRKSPRMLVIITPTAMERETDRLLKTAGVPVQLRSLGRGTATSDMLRYMGLGEAGKSVTLCPVSQDGTGRLLRALEETLTVHKPGNGIAFTVPISGISNPLLRLMDAEKREELQKRMESEVEQMKQQADYSLVLVTIDPGFSDEVMEAAKEAGAGGGTVIHARRLGMEDTMKFWGISVQGEKEIIAILAPQERRIPIMRAIGERWGAHSEAHGLVLSLPVEDVVGLADA